MSGSVALVGSGGFTPALESVDRELLASTGRRRPRVVVLAVAWNDRPEADRAAEIGRQHFAALGAEVEPVALGTAADPDDPGNAQAVGEADLVYLVGRRPDPVCRCLTGSAVGRAIGVMHRRGGTIAASEGAATALGEYQLGPRRRIGWPFRKRAGLALVRGVVIIPGYDTRPEVLRLPPILRVSRGTIVVGIDRETALFGDGVAWQVQGRGRVTVWRGHHRSRHRDGDILRFDVPGTETRGRPADAPGGSLITDWVEAVAIETSAPTATSSARDTGAASAAAPEARAASTAAREAAPIPASSNGDAQRGEEQDDVRNGESEARAAGSPLGAVAPDRSREEIFVDR